MGVIDVIEATSSSVSVTFLVSILKFAFVSSGGKLPTTSPRGPNDGLPGQQEVMTRMMMDRAEQQIDRLEDKIHAVLDTEVLHRRGR